MQSKAIGGNQRQSEAISGWAAAPWRGQSSEVISGNHRGNQGQSVVGQRLGGGVNHQLQSVAIKGCTIGGNRMQSVAIRWQSVDGHRLGGVYNQRRQSEAIGGNQCQSEPIRGHERQSDVIGGNQRQSDVISANQRQSEAIRAKSEAISCNQRQSEVIRGNQRQSVDGPQRLGGVNHQR